MRYELINIGAYKQTTEFYSSLDVAKFKFKKACRQSSYLIVILIDVEKDEILEVTS